MTVNLITNKNISFNITKLEFLGVIGTVVTRFSLIENYRRQFDAIETESVRTKQRLEQIGFMHATRNTARHAVRK